jgi:O-antigen ligase
MIGSGRERALTLVAVLAGALFLAHEALPFRSLETMRIAAAALAGLCALTARLRGVGLAPALIVVWCGWLSLSASWSSDPAEGARYASHIGQAALMTLLLATSRAREPLLRGLGLGFGVGGAALGVAFAIAAANGEAAPRIALYGVHPNLQARDAALGVLAAVLLVPGRLGGALAAMAGLAVGLANASGAALALLGGLGLAARRSAARTAVLAALMAVVAGGVALSAVPGARSPRSAVTQPAREEIGSGRLTLWAHGLRVAAEHPGRGAGIGAFPHELEQFRAASQRAGGEHTKPGRRTHSVYVDLLAETGAIGLLLFALLVVALIRERAEPALVVFVLLSALTESLLDQKGFWLAIALAMRTRPTRDGEG